MTKCTQIKFLEKFASIIPAPVYWVDNESRALGANQATLDEIECDALEDVIGKTPYDIYPYELADKIVKHNQEVFRTKKTLEQEECIKGPKTGEIRYYAAVKSPLFDEDGKICGLIGVSIGTSKEKKRVQLELEAVKKANVLKHLENIADSFPTPVYWNDLNSVVLGANEQLLKALGVDSAKKIIGKEIHEFHSKAMADAIVNHNRKVIETGLLLSQEEVIRDANTGKLKYFDAFKAPLRDEDGKIIGTLGTSIDITDKKRAEKLVKEKEVAETTISRLKTIAGSIAHELKNPLAGIGNKLGLIQLIAKNLMSLYQEAVAAKIVEAPQGKTPPEKIKECADAAYTRVEYARDYIEMQLANMSLDNIDTSKFVDCSISAVMQEALDAYSFDNAAQAVLVHWQGGADFSFVGSERLTVHIIWNLLSNALHYIKSENKGEITIWLASDAQYNYLHFKDTAKGMSTAMAAKVFGQFFTKREHGTGLGLAYCQMVMQAYGGDISCTAEEEKYAQFTLKFLQQTS